MRYRLIVEASINAYLKGRISRFQLPQLEIDGSTELELKVWRLNSPLVTESNTQILMDFTGSPAWKFRFLPTSLREKTTIELISPIADWSATSITWAVNEEQTATAQHALNFCDDSHRIRYEVKDLAP